MTTGLGNIPASRSPRPRDDFSMAVLKILAGEVGHLCSNPDCIAPTAGPSRQKGISNVGVGAHITAAAKGGPRFAKSLTPAKRSAVGNGLWLCGRCGRLVDNDADTYPVRLLRKWKRDAIERARRDLASGRRSEGIRTKPDVLAVGSEDQPVVVRGRPENPRSEALNRDGMRELRTAYAVWFGEIGAWLNSILGIGLELEASGVPVTSKSDGGSDHLRRLDAAKWQVLLLDTAAARSLRVKQLSAVTGLGDAPKPTTSSQHVAFGRRLVAVATTRLLELEAFQQRITNWFQTGDESPLV